MTNKSRAFFCVQSIGKFLSEQFVDLLAGFLVIEPEHFDGAGAHHRFTGVLAGAGELHGRFRGVRRAVHDLVDGLVGGLQGVEGTEAELRDALEAAIQLKSAEETERAQVLVGPHRDDLDITVFDTVG